MAESQLDILTGDASPDRLPIDADRVRRYRIDPVPKPRMTQADRWKKRPAVLRYHAFKDNVRALGIDLRPTGDRVIFILPMPKSWPKKDRVKMLGKPHQGRPDCDNLAKGLWDAVHNEDSHIFHCDALKFWGEHGEIIIERDRKALAWDGDHIIWETSP